MRLRTKIKALEAFVAWAAADKKAAKAKDALVSGLEGPSRDAFMSRAERAWDAGEARGSTRAAFNRLARSRRDWAREIYGAAKARAHDAAERLGGEYSGTWHKNVEWGDRTRAFSVTSRGDRYSSTCTFRKTDVVHTIILCAPDVARLDGKAPPDSELSAASSADGLPLLGVLEDGRYVWAARKGKRLALQEGWIAFRNGIAYHSLKSLKHAERGLARKLKALEEERLAKDPKTQRRLRLVALTCKNLKATVTDAEAMGYCVPGIRAFQNRHGIRDEASLAELVKTGNPQAVALALKLAKAYAARENKKRKRFARHLSGFAK
jgi:hypothetical protein